MSGQPVKIRIEIEGGEQARQAGEQIARSLAGIEAPARSAGEAVQRAERSVADFSGGARESTQQAIMFTQRLAAAGAAVQSLASAFGSDNASAGLIAKFAQATASGAQLGAVFGPQGALVGGIVGAAIPAIETYGRTLLESLGAVDRVIEGNEALARSYRNAGASALSLLNAQRMTERLDRGEGTFDELYTRGAQREAGASLRARAIAGDESAIATLIGNGTISRADVVDGFLSEAASRVLTRQASSLARGSATDFAAAQEAEQRRFDEAAERRAESSERRARSSGGGRASSRDTSAADAERYAREVAQAEQRAKAEAEQAATRRRDAADRARAALEEAEAEGKRQQRERAEREAMVLASKEELRLTEEKAAANERAAKAIEQQRILTESLASSAANVGGAITSGIGGAFGKAFEAAITGQEEFGKAFEKGMKSLLLQLGTQYVAEGVGALLTAAGNVPWNPPLAAAKAIEGGGKIALGVGLGAAGAAINTGAPAAQGPAARPQTNFAGSDAPKSRGVTINMNAPSVLGATHYDWGRSAGQHILAAQRRMGRAA